MVGRKGQWGQRGTVERWEIGLSRTGGGHDLKERLRASRGGGAGVARRGKVADSWAGSGP